MILSKEEILNHIKPLPVDYLKLVQLTPSKYLGKIFPRCLKHRNHKAKLEGIIHYEDRTVMNFKCILHNGVKYYLW